MKQRNNKCFIFDFDGTLFDTMYLWERVGETYLQSIGKQVLPTLREDLKTLTMSQSSQYLKDTYELTLSCEQIWQGLNQVIERFYLHEVKPKKGVIEFIKACKEQGIYCCIASASDRYLLEAALIRCGLFEYFDDIFTCSEIGHGKEEPHIFYEAMNKAGADKTTTIIFEDAIHAIETAKKADFYVVGVYDASECNQAKIQALSDEYIMDFNECLTFLRGESDEVCINNCGK